MSTITSDGYAAPLSVLRVDLSAIARNYLFLKKRLAAGADCAAVVKADAYGLGAEKVAPALFDQGCRHFFVAHAQEGVAVAQALAAHLSSERAAGFKGVEADIHILNGPHGLTVRDFAHHGLTPVLNTPGDLEYWAGAAPGAKALLHVDTGMNRMGINAGDVAKVAPFLQKIDIRYVMSHLSCADEPAHDMNARQLSAFRAAAAQLPRTYRLSLANSAGILLGGEYHFDLARPGCGLYGINPAQEPNPMQGVVTLQAKIVQIREIERAGAAGYGAAFSIAPPSKTATVSIGYADGYLRSLTGRGCVFIGGVSCPVIGRVSMDSVIVDVTHLQRLPQVGDMAEVIGAHQTVDDVAAAAGTIGYEIMTSLGARYSRVYAA